MRHSTKVLVCLPHKLFATQVAAFDATLRAPHFVAPYCLEKASPTTRTIANDRLCHCICGTLDSVCVSFFFLLASARLVWGPTAKPTELMCALRAEWENDFVFHNAKHVVTLGAVALQSQKKQEWNKYEKACLIQTQNQMIEKENSYHSSCMAAAFTLARPM